MSCVSSRTPKSVNFGASVIYRKAPDPANASMYTRWNDEFFSALLKKTIYFPMTVVFIRDQGPPKNLDLPNSSRFGALDARSHSSIAFHWSRTEIVGKNAGLSYIV